MFESRSHLFFFIGKIVGVTDIRTRVHRIQSQLALRPLGQFFSDQKFLYPILHGGRRDDPLLGRMSWKMTYGTENRVRADKIKKKCVR